MAVTHPNSLLALGSLCFFLEVVSCCPRVAPMLARRADERELVWVGGEEVP